MQEIMLQFGSTFKLCSLGEGQWKPFVEDGWSWVGGICKCLSANNAWGLPGLNSLGWPLISA